MKWSCLTPAAVTHSRQSAVMDPPVIVPLPLLPRLIVWKVFNITAKRDGVSNHRHYSPTTGTKCSLTFLPPMMMTFLFPKNTCSTVRHQWSKSIWFPLRMLVLQNRMVLFCMKTPSYSLLQPPNMMNTCQNMRLLYIPTSHIQSGETHSVSVTAASLLQTVYSDLVYPIPPSTMKPSTS